MAIRFSAKITWYLTSAYMHCVYGRAGVRYVRTKFSCFHRLPIIYLSNATPAPRALRSRGSSAIRIHKASQIMKSPLNYSVSRQLFYFWRIWAKSPLRKIELGEEYCRDGHDFSDGSALTYLYFIRNAIYQKLEHGWYFLREVGGGEGL